MALVEYSESECDSDNEDKATIPEPAKPKPTSTKPSFQKVVDRSNPHKIKLSLPEPTRTKTGDGDDESGPPTKRAKIGSGGLSGFNAFLPAPKRTTAPNGGPGAGGIKRGGLGSAVNLKTGAAPGFSREPEPRVDESSGWDESAEGGSMVESPVPNAAHPSTDRRPDMLTSEVDTQSKKKSTMFKPLSIANKKAQKKRVPPADSLHAPGSTNGGTLQPPNARPKASLFSTGDEANEALSNRSSTKGTYQPMVYHVDKPTITPGVTPYSEEDNTSQECNATDSTYSQELLTQPQPQSLDAIATDLNLSASAKRQLLGRHHNPSKTHPSQPSSIPNIVNFNTDEEYAANELLRQAGETVQHNPVRGIAPGKHSLKQLVNAASNQKDALEEQFASGRRNKKEAGSKYGW
ncbi:MAG: hypothetical protein ASARMPREDX12_006703 [Alectoria sarmentosa]|nr:MAG: hypothetical protein ASARMPREDX12_006703 [Alectoria sarmentosa]